jgi:prepilin-type N-terminal cleavage/methylation domain-containing protein
MTCAAPLKPFIRSKQGFTLLEVLVSLVIMALITTVAFAGLSIGIDSWRRGTRKIDELDRRFAIERLFQRQIASADPDLFRGNNRQLEFISGYSISNGAGHPVWVKYVSEANDLIYSETSVARYDPENPTVEVTERFPTLSPISFRYLYAMPNKQFEWTNESSMQSLPRAVRVEVSGDVLVIPMVIPMVSKP